MGPVRSVNAPAERPRWTLGAEASGFGPRGSVGQCRAPLGQLLDFAFGVLLDFAFGEPRLERVFLHVFDFNTRAIRVYERVGFTLEGTEREACYRHGRYHDIHLMGILRGEWAARDRARTWELD